MINAERLREVLFYDPNSGWFTWKVTRGGRGGGGGGPVREGQRAGSINGKGYWCIKIDGRKYQAHRLAFLYVFGTWPPAEIDHRDGDKANNKIANLRLATHSQNLANVGRRRNNTSGKRGVHWSKAARKWQAGIRVQGRRIHIGCFESKEEAAEAYIAKARELHGEFARAG